MSTEGVYYETSFIDKYATYNTKPRYCMYNSFHIIGSPANGYVLIIYNILTIKENIIITDRRMRR